MARSNPFRPFTPDPAQLALRPTVSGNTINGLGEAAQRPPRMVYWAPDPDDIAHGAMQRWFYQVDPDNPALARARAERARLLAQPLPERSGPAARHTPDAWTKRLQAFVAQADVEMAGVAIMDPAWIYEGRQVPQSRIIVLAVVHDYDAISTAPLASAGAEWCGNTDAPPLAPRRWPAGCEARAGTPSR